jgi:hypothetical protein
MLSALSPHDALGAGPSDAQVQAARELFASAEKDEDSSRWGEALEKLRRVYNVRATAGVRYHIALCEEQLGQLAGALIDYTGAESQARAENAKDVIRVVGPKLQALSPRVPRLTIHLTPAPSDSELGLDGEPIAIALLGVAIPIDPGVHKIEAIAKGYAHYTTSVTMRERESTVAEVKLQPSKSSGPAAPVSAEVPTSSPSPTTTSAPASTPPPSAELSSPESSKSGAVLATIAAIAFAGAGVGAYVVAEQKHDDGVAACASIVSTQSSACDDQKSAVRTWDLLAAGAWGGAALTGVVAVILWARPSHEPSRPTTGLVMGPSSLGVRGTF